MDRPAKKKRRRPEDQYFDELKGAPVVVEFMTGGRLRGTLVWVDVYSLGVRFEGDPDITLVYKQSVRALQKG